MKIVKPTHIIFKIGLEIAKNLAMKIPSIRKLRTKIGRTSGEPIYQNLDRYVYDLINKIQLHSHSFKDKNILEIGPGDHLATGLAMLALGAKSYSVLDRFPGDYDGENAKKWYKLLRENWKFGEWPNELTLDNWIQDNNVIIHRSSVEDFEPIEKYDIVCSYAVGEHVTNIACFALLNKNCIDREGFGLHYIDFSGHQWDRFDDPFLFLKFPDIIWNLMSSARGEPNRVRFDSYNKYFTDVNLKPDCSQFKKFEINKNDKWVMSRLTEGFLIKEATIHLTHS